MRVHELEGGWDSRARIVDGRWLERRPRRPEVEARLVQETRLLPWLAPQLPARVPVPVVVTRHPLVVRHELVPGEPAAALTAAQAAACGRFLAALHTVDVDGAVAHGTTDAGPAHDEHLAVLDRFRADVLPRLTPTERTAGAALLDRLSTPPPEPALVHADVGPVHLLVDGDALSGVIDWSDAHVGDPAKDLAWLVHGSGQGEAVVRAYGADAATLSRSHDWHLLGPWYEVTYGLDTDRPDLVASGIAGVRTRLNAP